MTSKITTPDPSLDPFLGISAILTGFSRLDLLGTGCAAEYLQEVTGAAGGQAASELWAAARRILEDFAGDSEGLEAEVRNRILADPKLGPLARAVLKMWLLGRWEQLPGDWRSHYGAHANDVDHVISVRAYQEGLVWRALGSHAPGAHAPGFASWSLPPRVTS